MEKSKKQKVQNHGQGLGRGLAGDIGLNFFFFFFPWFLAVWPKPRENQKKKKKFRPMGKVWGEAWLGTWVWTFCFFLFWFFHGFLQFGQNLEKTKKKKSSDPWARSGERPGWGHGSELFFFCFSMVFGRLAKTSRKPKKQKNKKFRPMGKVWGEAWLGTWVWTFCFFLFFWFFHGFLQFGQNLEKTKKKKKNSSDPWARSGERPGWGHGSELLVFFVFLVFPCFFAIWPKPRENQKKQKKQKVQTHGQGLGRGLAGDMGLIFSIVFCMFFMWRCFHHSTSQKMRVSTICTPAPPMSTPSVYIYI